MQRSTRIVEETMLTYGIDDWVEEVHRRRYRWAGRVARWEDGRWTKAVLKYSVSGNRQQGRPHMRWTDSFNKFYAGDTQNTTWTTLAQDENFWTEMEKAYLDHVLR